MGYAIKEAFEKADINAINRVLQQSEQFQYGLLQEAVLFHWVLKDGAKDDKAVKIVRLILDHAITVYKKNKELKLLKAAFPYTGLIGDVDLAARMLDEISDECKPELLCAITNWRSTALTLACSSNSVNMLDFLMGKLREYKMVSQVVLMRDGEGDYALERASEAGCKESIKALIKNVEREKGDLLERMVLNQGYHGRTALSWSKNEGTRHAFLDSLATNHADLAAKLKERYV